MTVRSQPATPGFFWHGVLIVLPVALLAGAGLLLVREDQRLAEQDARDRAQEILRQLAPGVGRSVADTLAGWSPVSDGHLGAFPVLPKGSANRTLPGMLGLGFLNESGDWIFPAKWDPAPSPPEWFLQLEGEPARAWAAARAAEWSGASDAEIAAAWQRLRDLPPGGELAACGEFALLRLQARTSSAAEAVDQLTAFGRRHSAVQSDTGLPLRAIALVLALRRAEEIGLTEPLLRALADDLLQPSLLTPGLLADAKRLAEAAPDAARQAVQALRQSWRSQEELRTVCGHLTRQVELKGLLAATAWFDGPSGRWLAVFSPAELPSQLAESLGNAPRRAIAARLYSKPAVAQAFTQVKNTLSLPAYFALAAELEGEPVLTAQPNNPGASQAGLLATVSGTLSNMPPDVRFQLAIHLADPAALYARQRQRARWLGAFILAAAGAAMVGFIRARRAYLRERQLNELKSNFVSSVSHELRAPIASVRLMAESLDLRKVRDPEKQRAYFRFIVQECRRLSALIANVLDFSRIEQGRKEYEFEPTDVSALVRETAALMQASASDRGVVLALDVPDSDCDSGTDRGPQPLLDGRAIQQALVNLIDNALKHAPKHTTVVIGASCDPENAIALSREKRSRPDGRRPDSPCVRIWVADQGPGIPPAEHERIFERFYRVGSELRRETQGVGIGLSIVKHIAEAHSGCVTVESESGKGSRFTLRLPMLIEKSSPQTPNAAAPPSTP